MSKSFYDYNKSMDDMPTSRRCSRPCPPNPSHPHKPSRNSYIVGNSVSFSIDECDNEVKADVTVNYRDTVRVWGQIKDCNGKPVPYAYVKLLKKTPNGLNGIAHTVTDCLGFYQFDICVCKEGFDNEYTILVGKASTGSEKVVSTGLKGANCNPCIPCDSDCIC